MKNIQDNKQLYLDLFKEAISQPGKVGDFYSYFHNYSFGNMVLLWSQGVNSPVGSFKSWGKVNRRVNKGASAKYICIPISFKGYKDNPNSDETEEFSYTRFFLKKCIFELNDTNGEDFYAPEVNLPEFDKNKLFAGLNIQEIDFSQFQSLNCQGYARPDCNQVAINPVATFPIKTMLHEVAHCLLHKRDEDGSLTSHGVDLPRDIREVEAEATAYLAGCFLDVLDDKAKLFSRGYIQDWMLVSELPEKNIQRIFGAVDKIIKALHCNLNINLEELA
ncbi:MAG: ImmA/IrrE family metallo-endopeptidase [Burkholderiales bacterium]|nr:ImmA/IrrE family metallo-endopeptidase [Burkholderiales bacterium]